jgi:hypothetical protein
MTLTRRSLHTLPLAMFVAFAATLTPRAAAQLPAPMTENGLYQFTYTVTNPLTREAITVTDRYSVVLLTREGFDGCARYRPQISNMGSRASGSLSGRPYDFPYTLNVPVYEDILCNGPVQTFVFSMHTEFAGEAPESQFHLASDYRAVCNYATGAVTVTRYGWTATDSDGTEVRGSAPIAGTPAGIAPEGSVTGASAPVNQRPDTGCGSSCGDTSDK